VQVLHLGRRGSGHGPQQRRSCDELLAHSRGRVRVVDVEVGVDALAGLPAKLTHAFTAHGGLSSDGGAKQSYPTVLLRELCLELARLSQLLIDICASRRRGGGALSPGF
jgi:hypothetical protein